MMDERSRAVLGAEVQLAVAVMTWREAGRPNW